MSDFDVPSTQSVLSAPSIDDRKMLYNSRRPTIRPDP